jgi:hypothetical protein
MKQFKLIISLILTCIITSTIQAQDRSSVSTTTIFKVNLVLPGIVYERSISPKNTLNTTFFSGFAINGSNNSGPKLHFLPTLAEEFRHYYNLDNRNKKGKSIYKNSGSYVGVRGYHIFESISTNSNNGYYESTTGASILWGFQKTFKRNFNINFNTGVNYDFRLEKTEAPILNITLGWVIGK